jgi:hypothetical protein
MLALIDGSNTLNDPTFASDKAVGTESPTFSASFKARASGLAFDPGMLSQLARERISATLAADRALQEPEKDKSEYKGRNLDVAAGTAALSVHYESQVVPEIDADRIRGEISGKSKQEASEILLSMDETERVDLTLFPSWQTSLPYLKSKIKIELKK